QAPGEELQAKDTYILTPNGDGINDYIDFSWAKPHSVKIYDSKGNLIKELKDTYIWDAKETKSSVFFYFSKNKKGKILVIK
ncbi:MAG: hypothetical protein ABDI07_08300, partial [Candidatus Kryptonium sp.]